MDSPFYEIVIAKSARAKCKLCGNKIDKDHKKLIYTDTSFAFGHSSEKSLCARCALEILIPSVEELRAYVENKTLTTPDRVRGKVEQDAKPDDGGNVEIQDGGDESKT